MKRKVNSEGPRAGGGRGSKRQLLTCEKDGVNKVLAKCDRAKA